MIDAPVTIGRSTPCPDPLDGPASRLVRVVLTVELVSAALLYTIGAGRSGWGNSYYAAAVQAGSSSWHAFLFGSLDPAGGMSIDKPPASVWLGALSVRLFGLTPEAVLWPQAACGVAAVALLYATVARQAGRSAGLLAGGLLAVTPVATLMARYNNPDELTVLLLVASAWAVVRSLRSEGSGAAWVAAAGALVGAAFLTKLGQALLVAPGLALSLAVGTPGAPRLRLTRLAVGGIAAILTAGWWVAVVELTPAADRPYVGGSTDNSVLGLTLGYNGLDRLTGAVPTGRPADWTRLFISGGQQAGWLLPAAVLLGTCGLWWVRRRPRTDSALAGLVLWSGWLLVTAVVLSSLKGTSHSYYSVQIVPAVAALIGIGASLAWQRCCSPHRATAAGTRALVGGLVLLSAVWMAVLLPARAPGALAVGVAGLAAAAGGAVGVLALRPGGAAPALRGLVVSLVVVSAALAPAFVSVVTAQAVHHGSGPRAGLDSGTAFVPDIPMEVVQLVRDGALGHRWAAGVPGRVAADLQLASGAPVFELGGYKAHDPSPTQAQLQQWTRDGSMHYLLLRDATGSGPVFEAISWARARFEVRDVAGWTVIDLTRPTTGADGRP